MEEVSTNSVFPFDDSVTSLDIVDKVYLEDFACTSTFYPNLQPLLNLQSLRLSISFEESNEITGNELYTKAIERLKHLAPNLQRLSFNGGYVYKPFEETTECVLKEIVHLRYHLDMLSSVLVNSNIPFLRLHFSAIFTFNEKTIRSANVPQILKNVFDFCDKINDENMLKKGVLDFIYISNGLPITIRLLLNVSILKKFLSEPRTRFYDGKSFCLSQFFKF